jgi:hypothetical protein
MELRARLAMGLCSLVHQHLQCVGLYSLMTERECPWQHIDRRLAYEVHTTQPHALNINTLDLKITVLFQLFQSWFSVRVRPSPNLMPLCVVVV